MDLTELAEWARDNSGAEPPACDACQPRNEASGLTGSTDPATLTPLARNVLDYVLETAIVHLTNGGSSYRLTVGDIAACLHKTPGQLAQVIRRLLDGGYLSLSPSLRRDGSASVKAEIKPTATALRVLDAYREFSDIALHAELKRL
jgi:hypothetical protein